MKPVTKVLTGMAIVASLAATSALAATSDDATAGQGQGKRGPNSEQRAAVEQAVEEGNYAKWYELITQNGRQPKITEVINEGNFSKLNDMHEAMQSGDKDAAKTIADELGIPGLQGKGRMNGDHGRRGGHKGLHMDEETRAVLDAAIESGDYEAFKAVHEEKGLPGGMFEQVTEDNFARFAEMHEARQNGDNETAKAIADELGLKRPEGKGFKNCENDHGDHVEFGRSEEEEGRGPRGGNRVQNDQ